VVLLAEHLTVPARFDARPELVEPMTEELREELRTRVRRAMGLRG
jgi:hypothetical protein